MRSVAKAHVRRMSRVLIIERAVQRFSDGEGKTAGAGKIYNQAAKALGIPFEWAKESVQMAVIGNMGRALHVVERAPQWEPTRRKKAAAHKVVYFALAPDRGLVKIGFTGNLGERIGRLSYKEDVYIELIGCVPGDMTTEAFFHERCREFHSHGEWFRDCPELRALIASAAAEVCK